MAEQPWIPLFFVRNLTGKIAAALVLLSALPAGALELANHGYSEYSVIIPAQATPMEKYAAEEFVTNLEKVAKVKLPVVPETAVRPDKAVYIGNTAFAQASGLGGATFASEEFEIRTQHDSIIVAGSPIRGTLYGVYELLEQAAGVRFLALDCTYAPLQSTVSLPDRFQLRRRPAFRFRGVYIDGNTHADREWAKFTRRIGLNHYGDAPELGFNEAFGSPRDNHTYCYYTKDLPVEHSWMNREGKRIVVNTPYSGALCYTDPAVVDHVEKRLRAYIEADRKAYAAKGAPAPVYYCVDSNDCPCACYCPECQKFIAEHGVSGVVVDFTNRLADRIKSDYPEIKIMMFAYQDSFHAPRSGVKAHDNVIVRLAAMDNEFHASDIPCDVMRKIEVPGNQQFVRMLDEWHSVASNLAAWGYWRMYCDPFPSPQSNTLTLAGLIRKYRELGVEHYFVEMEMDSAVVPNFFDLRMYVGGKLMANPELDDQKLIDEFFQGYYGDAAPEMRKVLELLENSIAAEAKPLGMNKLQERTYLNTPEFYKSANQLFEEALHKVPADSAYTGRIDQERLPFDLAYLLMAEKIGNPLPESREAIVERCRKAFKEIGEKYPWKKTEAPECGEKLLQKLVPATSAP